MKSDLGISISVSAVIGGALSGLTNIGKPLPRLAQIKPRRRRLTP